MDRSQMRRQLQTFVFGVVAGAIAIIVALVRIASAGPTGDSIGGLIGGAVLIVAGVTLSIFRLRRLRALNDAEL